MSSAHTVEGDPVKISAPPLLSITDLKVDFRSQGKIIRVIDGVSFTVKRGRTLGVVGESGCGKSVTAMTVMGLIPRPPGIIAGGRIRLDNTDLLQLSASGMRQVRGDRIAIIFQEPMTSLDPVYNIGDQIVESILAHRRISHGEAFQQALGLLKKVRIPEPEERLKQYPHNLSGGMRQRVMIAMALACDPELLIADEPTTALDVTIQAQILDLLKSLKDETGMALMLITHDLGVIAEVADEVVVMYAGKIVEQARVENLFAEPHHPYTIGLLGSIPRIDDNLRVLATIKGRVPPPFAMPSGCRFHPRCPFALDHCRTDPVMIEIQPEHWVACWRAPLGEIS